MKWFKHMAYASDDEFISGLEDQFGIEGYGRWWKLMEIIARQMDSSERCHAEYSWAKWQTFLKGKRNKLETFLVHCQNQREINLEQSGNILKISCPKLLTLRDEYSRKSGHAPDATPDKVAQEGEGRGKRKEEDTSTTYAGGRVGEPPDQDQVMEVHDWVVKRISSPSRFYPYAPIVAWLGWGADFDLDIKPSVERFLARKKGAPGSLSWLDEYIADSIQQRQKPMPEGRPPPPGRSTLQDQVDQQNDEVLEKVRRKFYEQASPV